MLSCLENKKSSCRQATRRFKRAVYTGSTGETPRIIIESLLPHGAHLKDLYQIVRVVLPQRIAVGNNFPQEDYAKLRPLSSTIRNSA